MYFDNDYTVLEDAGDFEDEEFDNVAVITAFLRLGRIFTLGRIFILGIDRFSRWRDDEFFEKYRWC